MCDAELLRVMRGSEAFVEPPLKAVDLVFTWLEVVTGSTGELGLVKRPRGISECNGDEERTSERKEGCRM